MGLALLVLFAVASCMPRGPVIDTGSAPDNPTGTIAGTVRAAGSAASLSGRRVTAINVSTGQRFEVSTATNGGYTLKVPVGRYRMEVELRAGESLAETPDETQINASDMDADRDFTITVKQY
jgi:hypothetical protein